MRKFLGLGLIVLIIIGLIFFFFKEEKEVFTPSVNSNINLFQELE